MDHGSWWKAYKKYRWKQILCKLTESGMDISLMLLLTVSNSDDFQVKFF